MAAVAADQVHSGVAVLVRGRVGAGSHAWTQVLDAVRVGPDDYVAEMTGVQGRAVVQRPITAGQRLPGAVSATARNGFIRG